MKTFKRVLLALALLAPWALAADPASAQTSPTPEGTVIANVATVSFQDTTGTDYPQVADTVEVTVGFLAGIDVQGPGTLTPPSPATGAEADFVIENTGNGDDLFEVTGVNADAGLTITGYIYEGNPYATLLALNAAIAADDSTAMGGSITVTVVFDVDENLGGQSLDITLNARSVRDNAETDSDVATIEPPDTDGVTVTPDDQAITRFPGTHTEDFVVTNDGSDSDTFTLTTQPGTGISVVSVSGPGVSGGQVTLDAGESVTVSVEFTIDFTVPAGGSTSIQLTATSGDDAGVDDTGDYDITVTRPTMAMTKTAYKHDTVNNLPDESDPIDGGDEVLPGETIWYKLEIENEGDQPASAITVTDVLPAQVTYVANAGDGGTPAWVINYNGGTFTVTGTLSGELAAGSSRYFWIRVTIK
ncbi:MAG TPA: hypothetical protein VFQ45_09950 [Longimicrobium sp.]|nr:hypothetical protein [Longimicrobium sp.]